MCVCVCPCSTGLLNLEVLLRQFLISKETLSVRMLDDSQDPTPLLKEIRDDKTATIIVDANATMSHIILERVRRSYTRSTFLDFVRCVYLNYIQRLFQKDAGSKPTNTQKSNMLEFGVKSPLH